MISFQDTVAISPEIVLSKPGSCFDHCVAVGFDAGPLTAVAPSATSKVQEVSTPLSIPEVMSCQIQ